ncbi:MAG: mandelate racemase [Proteobacteria bacterium]|nr:mandelate racemase [Pseudomonadota bacterium]
MVTVRVDAGGCSGLGYTYGHRAVAVVIADSLAPLARGRDAFDTAALHGEAVAALRNIGHPGLGAMAVSALDVALWDLKARLLQVSLPDLLGTARERVPVYGSGGFTSYDDVQLSTQLSGWIEQGIDRVKMKIGREPGRDAARVNAARAAIGSTPGLMVDANGAYDRGQALALAPQFGAAGVDWFEEPLSSDDLPGLRLLRDRLPAGMELAAGEYGWDVHYFLRMLAAGAVDVLQVDATRCGGYSGFLQAAALARAHHVPLSAHCAPALHAPVCAALPELRHVEYFHDHVCLEALAFDGAAPLRGGMLVPDRACPGHGLTLREQDLAAYRV